MQLAALVTAQRPDAPEQHVVSLLRPGAVTGRIAAAGVPVDSLDMPRGMPDPRAALALSRIIRNVQPDAIQSWMYHADLAATLAWRLSGLREATQLYWGVRCSDMDMSRYGAGLRGVIGILTRLSTMPAAVIANSEAGRRVHEDLGYRPRRFVVIPNGIDVEHFRPDPAARATVRAGLGITDDTPLVAHIARVDPMKDHETMLDACGRLPGVAVLAAGAGTEDLPDRPGLIRLGVRTDTPALFAACDVVASSSAFGEGFPNVLGEGMAAGLPAAATSVGDSAEIVGDCGSVVPPGNPEALATAIGEIVNIDSNARSALGRRARERIIERYSLARAVARYDALYRGEDPDACAA